MWLRDTVSIYIRDARRCQYGLTAHDRKPHISLNVCFVAQKRTIKAIGLQSTMSTATGSTNRWDWVVYSKRDPRDLQALQVYRLETSHMAKLIRRPFQKFLGEVIWNHDTLLCDYHSFTKQNVQFSKDLVSAQKSLILGCLNSQWTYRPHAVGINASLLETNQLTASSTGKHG